MKNRGRESSLSGNMEEIVTLMGRGASPAEREVWWKVDQEDHLGLEGNGAHVARISGLKFRVVVTETHAGRYSRPPQRDPEQGARKENVTRG